MFCQLLSETVFAVHLAITLFTLFGVVLVYKSPRLVYVHVPIVLWMIMVNVADLFCPLTFLEDWLRSKSGIAGYESSVIEGYILELINQHIHPIDPERVEPRHNALVWAAVFSVANGLGYVAFFWRRNRFDGEPAA